MVKNEWLCCNGDWSDIINIIKLEKNCDERLREFRDILKREELTTKNIIDQWCVIEKSDIKICVNEWFYDNDLEDVAVPEGLTYWFFNINTGEALHIKYSVTISCSGIVVD